MIKLELEGTYGNSFFVITMEEWVESNLSMKFRISWMLDGLFLNMVRLKSMWMELLKGIQGM